jgi:hypothetical protein
MMWTRLRNRRTSNRVAAVDGWPFPAGGRHRLEIRHPHLDGDDIRLVEAATRQWFRVVARHPRATLSVPSVVVNDLWYELTLHTRDYAALCDAAFSRSLPRRPEPAMAGDAAKTNRAPALLATLDYARQDEGCRPTDLPLLFRVDRSVRIADGNCYLADCGGRGECFRAPGLICLQHLDGLGKSPGARGIRGDPPNYSGLYDVGGGGG